MKRSAKYLSVTNMAPPGNSPQKSTVTHNTSGLFRVAIVSVFGFIALAVANLNLHLLKMESSYVSKRDNQGNVMDVHKILKKYQDSRLGNFVVKPKLEESIKQINAFGNNKNGPITGRGSGSKRGHINCSIDVDLLVSYWNDPLSDEDRSFQSPFLKAPDATADIATRYLSFEPDLGGWNNIRMEFEIMVVFAATTGRTLILPPDYPVYLLHLDSQSRHRGLQDFFQYGVGSDSKSTVHSGFDDIVNVITMRDFFHKEILEKKSYSLPLDQANKTKVLSSIQKCNYRTKDSKSCIHLFDHMAIIADLVPTWNGEAHCLIMDDKNWYKDVSIETSKNDASLQVFCGNRSPVYYNRQLHDAPLVHFRSHTKKTRLLVHFYAFIYFTDPKIGNYYKRMVRDRVRYSDPIHCAAGKVVKSILDEFGGFSSMHIRRGDFQWPEMRISATEWLENTRHILHENELVYISTDEKDLTFFEPLRSRYRLKFLTDYKVLAGLDELDPNFIGMIDAVIASRGREFVGTYFSSFSAYIGRLRGYHGMSGNRMHYGYLARMNETHSWVMPHSSYSAREFPIGWTAIDGDTEATEEDFF